MKKMDRESVFIYEMMNKVISGSDLSFEEAERLIVTTNLDTLTKCANIITRTYNGNQVDVESLINAKSGNCREDCHFCRNPHITKKPGYGLIPCCPRNSS